MNQQLKIFSIAAFSLFLMACSVDNSNSCTTQQDTTIKQTAPNGLTLEPSTGAYLQFDQIQAVYDKTQACMGMTAPGPTIVYKNFEANNIGSAWAFYSAAGELIWVNNNMNEYQGFKRDCRTDTEALQHEFVHHILNMNGSNDISRDHSAALFEQCGVGVNTYN